MEISMDSRTRDEQRWLVTASSDTEPGQTLLFDRTTHKLTPQYKVREKLPRQDLAAMTSVTYTSSDGLEIPAYLTLPKGVDAKNLPALVIPHGGPWGRDVWGYNSLAQFLANRGYAVLMPNFRGSTGYGRKFLDAGNLEWGRKMQDDLTWGVKYLVAQGIADPKRVGILGGSYGGYATLAGVTFTPDVYAAAVDIVGPSNLITLLDSIPPYWESARKVMYERMGNPTTAEGKALLVAESPIHSTDKIRTPLLVAQGANDPRVNRREAEQIVVALRDRGFPVEYILAPDEGHGFQRPVNNAGAVHGVGEIPGAASGRAIPGGRNAGGGGSAEGNRRSIRRRWCWRSTMKAAAVGVPKTAADLTAGDLHYQVKIEMGGQQMAMKLATTIEDGGDARGRQPTRWIRRREARRIRRRSTRSSLIVKKRSVKQGPVTIDVDFAGDKAAGQFTMNGQTRPIAVDLGGPLFGDAAGGDQVDRVPAAGGGIQHDVPQFRSAVAEGAADAAESGGRGEGDGAGGNLRCVSAGDDVDGRRGEEDAVGRQGLAESGEGDGGGCLDGWRRGDGGAGRVGGSIARIAAARRSRVAMSKLRGRGTSSW